MTWGSTKQKDFKEPPKKEFFKKSKGFVHDQGLKCLAWGKAEVGKTYLALSFPSPIYVIDTEFGTAPVTRHFPEKDIFIYEAAILDPSTDEPDVEASLKNLEEAVATLKDVSTGTIVIDSGTDIWQWLGAWVEQQARKSGRMTSAGTPQRLEWGRANLRWRQLILRLMAKPVNFVITAQAAQEYTSKGEATDDYRAKVQGQTPHMCDIIVELQKTYVLVEKGKPMVSKYMATLEKCRFQRGLDLKIEDITYDSLVAALEKQLGVVIKTPGEVKVDDNS